MGLPSGTTASNHGQLPETGVKNGRNPILPAVWPLARVPSAPLWWSLAVQINPTWSPVSLACSMCWKLCGTQTSTLQEVLLVTTCAPPLKQLLDCALQSRATHLPTTPKVQLVRTALPSTHSHCKRGKLPDIVFALGWDFTHECFGRQSMRGMPPSMGMGPTRALILDEALEEPRSTPKAHPKLTILHP